MGNQNWTQATDALGHFQQSEKRLGIEERRSKINKASDLLGPLAGPSAVVLEDSLNSPSLGFNGLFIVPPGTAESPDPLKWWIGQSIAQDGIGGVQVLYTFQPADAPHKTKMRGWQTVVGTGGLRAYSDWQDVGAAPYVPPEPGDRRSIASKLLSGFTVTAGHSFEIRSDGIWREVHGLIDGSFPANSTTTITTALDAADRPSDEAWAGAYLSGSNPGAVRVAASGLIGVSNAATSTRTQARFTVVYTVDE